MPLKTWDTQADWDVMYSKKMSDGSYAHYERSWMYRNVLHRARGILQVTGWDVNSKVVIVGAGYGWLAEALIEIGGLLQSNIVCVDTSTYIASTKDANSGNNLVIETYDLSKAKDRNALERQISGYDLLTDHVLDSYTDAEIGNIRNWLNSLKSVNHIYHHTVTSEMSDDWGGNYKTLQEWRDIIPLANNPTTFFIEAGTFRML